MTTSKSLAIVAGAGASLEVGLPLGVDLIKQIREAVDPSPENLSAQGAAQLFRKALGSLSQRTHYQERELYEKARDRLFRGMLTAPSIDNYLDMHYKDKHLNACGKLAIASCILQAEAESDITIEPGNIYNNIKYDQMQDNWLQVFFKQLQLNTPFECLAARLKRLAIVTFNYDRCIEHYLHSAIRNSYDVSSEDAASVLRDLDIVHAYGSLGPLPWQGTAGSIDFGAGSIARSTIVDNALALKTFTETTDEDEEVVKNLREIMRNTERLVFLGFAYYKQNMELLFGNGERPPYSDPVKRIYGSALGISSSDLQVIQMDFVRRCQLDSSQLAFPSERCFQIMNRFSRSLELPNEGRP